MCYQWQLFIELKFVEGSYQKSIDGVIDGGKVADDERQQVGGHFLSGLKPSLQHILSIDCDTAWVCRR